MDLSYRTALVIPFLILVVASLLVACGGPPNGGNEYDRGAGFKEFTVPLQDGREITCLWRKSGYGGGLSCDWTGTR